MHKSLLIILALVLLAGGALGWFFSTHPRSRTKTANANTVISNIPGGETIQLASTLVLHEYHAAHLTTAQTTTLIADLNTQTKYHPDIGTEHTLVGDCGTSANVDILKKLDAQRTVQTLNGSYVVVRTPNLQGWDMAAANQFMNDPTIICGSGFYYPFAVTADAFFWRLPCSDGMIPTDGNGNMDTETTQCFQAQEAISIHYHLTD